MGEVKASANPIVMGLAALYECYTAITNKDAIIEEWEEILLPLLRDILEHFDTDAPWRPECSGLQGDYDLTSFNDEYYKIIKEIARYILCDKYVTRDNVALIIRPRGWEPPSSSAEAAVFKEPQRRAKALEFSTVVKRTEYNEYRFIAFKRIVTFNHTSVWLKVVNWTGDC